MGLVYGDILPYPGIFPPNNISVFLTYREKAVELKDKIQQVHPIKKDKRNRPEFINKNHRIEIKLECYENNKFKIKTKQRIVKFVPWDKSYDIHLLAKEHFNIQKSTQTFLGEYNGKDISKNFEIIDTYALAKKEKKLKI